MDFEDANGMLEMQFNRLIEIVRVHIDFGLSFFLMSLMFLLCFSYVSLIGTNMSESFNIEHIERHIRVKREVHKRQKGGTWEDDPNIVKFCYDNTIILECIL